MIMLSCDFSVCTLQPNQSHMNVICTGEGLLKSVHTLQCFICSTKSGNCLSCDQSTWGLPSTEQCNYFAASCDAAVQLCLLHCEGVAAHMIYNIVIA